MTLGRPWLPFWDHFGHLGPLDVPGWNPDVQKCDLGCLWGPRFEDFRYFRDTQNWKTCRLLNSFLGLSWRKIFCLILFIQLYLLQRCTSDDCRYTLCCKTWHPWEERTPESISPLFFIAAMYWNVPRILIWLSLGDFSRPAFPFVWSRCRKPALGNPIFDDATPKISVVSVLRSVQYTCDFRALASQCPTDSV